MTLRRTWGGLVAVALISVLVFGTAQAAPPKGKMRTKFYDFSEQIIDGEIKKPTALYTDARAKVRFERLLKLKKSFLRDLFDTAKHKVFK
jgi:hypothetical protein